MFFPLCVPGSILAGHLSGVGVRSAQRIAPPLSLVHAQRLQRLGLCVLQRGRLFNRSWYVLNNFHVTLDSTRGRMPIVPGKSTMSTPTTISFLINALIIFSTIHAQDFRDENGDKLMGRRTIPMLWPKSSRVWIFVVLIAWSVGLSWACDLTAHFSVPFCALAFFTGLRFLRKRTADGDKLSYRYYNVRVLLDGDTSYVKCLNYSLLFRSGLWLLKSCIFRRLRRRWHARHELVMPLFFEIYVWICLVPTSNSWTIPHLSILRIFSAFSPGLSVVFQMSLIPVPHHRTAYCTIIQYVQVISHVSPKLPID
jgi:hypothetical protein